MGYLAPVSEVKQWHKGWKVIGDTVFIDGSPHIYCAICGILEKKFNGAVHVAVSGGRKQKQIVSYKVMVGKWIFTQDTIWDKDGFPSIQSKCMPSIHQEPACFKCWEVQQQRKAANPGKAVFYKLSELFRKD